MKDVIYRQLLVAAAVIHGDGCTINTKGENPSEGFVVALEGYEKRHQLQGEVGPLIRKYIDENYKLAVRGNWSFGLWVEGGEIVLNVSRIYNDKLTAIERGILNSQKAIWDVINDKAIYLPEPQKAGTYTQQVDYAKEKAKELAAG